VKAIAIGLFITAYIAFFINSYYSGKLINYGAFKQIYDWRYIILSVIIMALGVLFYLRFVSSPWLQLIGGGILGGCIYFFCCMAFKIIDADILRMMKSK
jgi:hypothetical protein